MISRRKGVIDSVQNVWGSNKWRTASVHEIYRLNSYSRGMEAEGKLGWNRLRAGWMGRKLRASIQNSSIFIYTYYPHSVYSISTLVFQITSSTVFSTENFSWPRDVHFYVLLQSCFSFYEAPIKGYGNIFIYVIILSVSFSPTAHASSLNVVLGQFLLTIVSQNSVQSWHVVGTVGLLLNKKMIKRML